VCSNTSKESKANSPRADDSGQLSQTRAPTRCHPEEAQAFAKRRPANEGSMYSSPSFYYIVTNRSKTLYTGATRDLERRVSEHKQGIKGEFAALRLQLSTQRTQPDVGASCVHLRNPPVTETSPRCHPEEAQAFAKRRPADEGSMQSPHPSRTEWISAHLIP
jgi:hypothetical protein